MAGWNLALRLGLEIAALVGIGGSAWQGAEGTLRWVAAVAAPLVAVVLWGTFNVLGDPSRSGKAPIEVSGLVRLTLEAFVLGAGGVGLLFVFGPWLAASFVALTTLHYAAARKRIRWLLDPSHSPGD